MRLRLYFAVVTVSTYPGVFGTRTAGKYHQWNKTKTTLKGGSVWELAEFIPMKSGLEQPAI